MNSYLPELCHQTEVLFLEVCGETVILFVLLLGRGRCGSLPTREHPSQCPRVSRLILCLLVLKILDEVLQEALKDLSVVSWDLRFTTELFAGQQYGQFVLQLILLEAFLFWPVCQRVEENVRLFRWASFTLRTESPQDTRSTYPRCVVQQTGGVSFWCPLGLRVSQDNRFVVVF